jgi:glucose repression mediator protein
MSSHFEINKFLAEANETIEKGFSTAALVANEMKSMTESSNAAKRVFAYNPNSKAMHDLFPNYSILIQTITNLIDKNTKQISKPDADPNSWVTLGHGYLMIGDFPNAFSAYAQAQRNIPNNTNTFFWYAIGIVYHHYNYKDHAQSCFNRVLQEGSQFPYYADLSFRNAILARSNGKFDEALGHFKITRSNPPNGLCDADILFQIAHTYQLMGRKGEATSIYQSLYQTYPNLMVTVNQYAWSLFLNDWNRHKDLLNTIIGEALKQEPDEPNLLILSARIAMKENNTELAYNFYRESISYWSENPYFWCGLGYLYFKNDQSQDAYIAFRRALIIKNDIEQAWLNIGLYFEQNNDLVNALEAYKNGALNCERSRELQNRIVSLSSRKVGQILPQAVDVDDVNFFEDAPKKFASLYVSAVPVLPSSLLGKEAEGLKIEELSTFPKSLFA